MVATAHNFEPVFQGAIDIRKTGKALTPSQVNTPANYATVATMRTRLAAISAGYYTSARLDQMTVNDMIWAIRQADDPTSIKQ